MNKEDYYIRYDDLIVSLLELRVWFQEKEIHFTSTELRLLLAFLEDPFKTIPAEDLIQRTDLTSLKSLYGLISRVRSLLDQKYIVTHGAGYSFVNGYQYNHHGERHELKTN